MATALATLPLMGATAGDGDVCLTATAGAGLAAGFATGLVGALVGLAAAAGLEAALVAGLAGTDFFGATWAAGLTVFFATGFGWGLLTFLAGAAFLAIGAGFRATAFLAGACFAAALPTGFTDLATVFLATALRTTGFLVEACLAGALRAGAVFLAGALLPARALVAATLGLLAMAAFALPAAFPFCALAAVELRVVFAISLHRFGRGGRVL